MNGRKKILWLSSWYPNKYEPFAGDFIQRHAYAAALEHNIHVIFVTDSPEQDKDEEVVTKHGNLTEQVIYFKTPKGIFGKIKKQKLFWQHFKSAFNTYIALNDDPDLVHVHIPWKVGLIALWIKIKYHKPFIITEHWNIYNDVVDDKFGKWPMINQYLLKRIYNQAKEVVSVSNFLGKCLVNKKILKKYIVIPNVVDASIFLPSCDKNEVFTFIHVSNMVPLKNVRGIIDSFHTFLNNSQKTNVQLVMIGKTSDEYKNYASSLNLLDKYVIFKGEISHQEVAFEMQRSHCLVINSNIENAPCVISEAQCTGMPVIATNVGGIPEMVDETNGILISAGENIELQKAFDEMVINYKKYNQQAIVASAIKRYSVSSIAKLFNKIYQNRPAT